jgi:hypothetical protein
MKILTFLLGVSSGVFFKEAIIHLIEKSIDLVLNT